ncbi:MAG TPA: DoxX family membrane protein [Pseudonocardia sp.]
MTQRTSPITEGLEARRMLNRALPAPTRDIAILIGRVILGVVLFAHGWQKLVINGIAGTYGQFEKLGIPLAIVSASFASFVEFVGGVLIIVGALTTTVVALDLVVMVGAAGFVHITHGVFAQDGGWELVGVIVAAELALAAHGPGRFSVDHLVTRLREREHDDLRRRLQRPVRRPAATSETFTPVVETSAAPSYPVGGFAAADQVEWSAAAVRREAVPAAASSAGQATGDGAATGALPVTSPGPTSVGAYVAAAATTAVPSDVFAPPTAAASASSARLPTADALAAPTVGLPVVRGAVVTDPPAAAAGAAVPGATASAPRMASAGVHRAMSERTGLPAGDEPPLFGVIVQSPLDFTPTTAFPAVPSSSSEMVAAAPGALPRRVRHTPDLPPASAVRPYA